MNDNEKYLEKLKTHRRHLHQIPEIDRDLPGSKALQNEKRDYSSQSKFSTAFKKQHQILPSDYRRNP